MSLDHLPTSSSRPRRALLPQALMVSLAMALAACGDKPSAPVAAPEVPSRAPTGTIDETLTNVTFEARQALVQQIYEATLGATGGDFYTRRFDADPDRPKDWRIHQLDVGFGPQGGVHVVTVKQEGQKTWVNDMLDANGDGLVDSVESSTSWPLKTEGTATPMMRFEKSYVVSNRTLDNFASALRQALRVLEEEKKTQKGE